MGEYLLALLSLISVPDLPDLAELEARREAIIDAINLGRENLYDITRGYVFGELNDFRDGLGDRFDNRLPEDLPDLPGGSDSGDDDE